jgi:hypothetical protein
MVPWLPLYRIRGQGIYKAVGSPDRRIMSLREGLANLACKLCCLEVHVRAWCRHALVATLRMVWHGATMPAMVAL